PVLVLEAAGLDRALDAALLGRVLLPPPAAGARILAGGGRTGAGDAADRGVALVVEGVVRHVVGPAVVPDLLVLPAGQRVALQDAAVIVVDLDLADVRAAGSLGAGPAGHACGVAV